MSTQICPPRFPNGDPDGFSATVSTVERALNGESQILATLIDYLTPIVHYRVARVVRGRRPDLAFDQIRPCVEDLTQEILMILFSGPTVLRDWDPARGLTVESFVDMVARRRALSHLSAKSRDPFFETATEDSVLDRADVVRGPERRALAADRLQKLLRRLRQQLSKESWSIFELFWLKELSPMEIVDRTGMSRDAFYARVSRIRKLIRGLDLDGWVEA